MVWGGVSQHHRTELVVIAGNLMAVRYREDILLPHVIPFLHAHPDMILQHDNSTRNTARSVRDFLQERNVSVLPWTVKSPDLNPIEHVWDLLNHITEMDTLFHFCKSHVCGTVYVSVVESCYVSTNICTC